MPDRYLVPQGTIERDPAKLRAYYSDFERLIARGMDELYALAVKDGCRQKRAALADIEYRASMVLKGFRQECANSAADDTRPRLPPGTAIPGLLELTRLNRYARRSNA